MFWIYFGQTWVFCQLDKITFAPLLGIDKCKLIFSFASLFASYSSYISVRAMQYVLDMALNTKIPDDLVHKLSFECFRNWLQCLKRLWFNFKICGIFPQLSVVFTRLVFMRPFWSLITLITADQSMQLGMQLIKIHENNNTFYRSWWIIRVTRSRRANLTNIGQQMPTFQNCVTKATRPKAKFYYIYMVAYGPNHQVF